MDFGNLPDKVLTRVFEQLPLAEKFRVGAVDRRFRRVSKLAISQTTFLCLDGVEYGNLPRDALRKMYDLCREKLEDVCLPTKFIETFAELSFPRLTTIRLKLDDDRGFDWVEIILANNPAVKELYLKVPENRSGQFASTGATYANLTRLVVAPKPLAEEDDDDEVKGQIVDGTFLRLLSGRCPNLKQLFLNDSQLHDDEAQSTFEDFFAHCPTLEELELGVVPGLNLLGMASFWRLELLRELFIFKVSDYISGRGDDFLVKVARSFPLLRNLQVLGLKMTNRGVGALVSLNDLMFIDLNGHVSDLQTSLLQLAQKGKLAEIALDCWIEPSTFLTVVSNCPDLGSLCLAGVRNVKTPAQAAELVTSLGRWNRKREIDICFMRQIVWGFREVHDALEELKENEELKVKIK